VQFPLVSRNVLQPIQTQILAQADVRIGLLQIPGKNEQIARVHIVKQE